MNKRLVTFLEFLIGGIILGIVEDLILIKILNDNPITLSVFLIIFAVTLPFAFVGEYIVDKIDFIKMFNLNKKAKNTEIFFEFLIWGIALGVLEDLIAFYFATGDKITPSVIITATLIAIPFAFSGEILIDKLDISKSIKEKKFLWKK